ncbi:hypothetical protein CXB51_007636 [Gossypium anomalum]|uniref:FRIGIDA-like protein n=1 Tax=Gossypium anomalum TaxID=47600 RepID=A0A8J5ZIH4_9ROSI|nr:hypothetical protein CXB51_007636 [Gossypium anomalum]
MAKPSQPFVQLNSLPSIKQQPLPSPLSLPPPEPLLQPLAVLKTEPEHQQQQPSPPPQQQHGKPHFLKSMDDLASLSSAIHAFQCRFDDLTKHLDFINQAIDSKLYEPQQQKRPEIETQSPPKAETDGETEKKGPDTASPPKSSRSEIQSLCGTMCSKGLRKYIATHLSNVPKLREEVPEALKLAPEPARLVLDCIGRFFLQGIKAYDKESPMIPARLASVLALEFFLLMMGGFHAEGKVKIGGNLKAEAENGAIAWRKRLINEGGLAKASEVDARGLLLFVAGFGIPKVFRIEDLGNLLRLCNLRAISDALKASPVLPDKMPDIIEDMAKNGMHVEAVDVASILGLEDKCSLKKILTIFLQESAKSFKRAKQEAQNSPFALRMANERQLDALKSVVRYSEDCSSDVAKFLGSWQIEEKIVKLEEENAELHKRIEERKMIPKRKLDEMGSSSRVKSQEMKRSRFATIGSPLPNSSHVNGLHEQRATSLTEGMRLYESAISVRVAPSYPAASAIPHGLTVGSLPRNGVAQMVGINGVGSSSMMTSIGAISRSSYSRAHGEIEVNKAEQTISSALPYGGRRQHSGGQSATSMRFASLYGSSASIEGFVGLPDTTDRTSADLYRFADSLGENESYNSNSHRTSTLPNVAPRSLLFGEVELSYWLGSWITIFCKKACKGQRLTFLFLKHHLLYGFLHGNTIEVEGDTGNLQFSFKFNILHDKYSPHNQTHSHFPSLNSMENNMSCRNSSSSSYQTPKRGQQIENQTLENENHGVEIENNVESETSKRGSIMTRLRSGAISQVKYSFPRICGEKPSRTMKEKRKKKERADIVLDKLLQRRTCPVKPCNSYVFFVMAGWDSVQSSSFGDASKRLSQIWCRLPRKQKKIYEDIALNDSARYKRQCMLLNCNDQDVLKA